MKLCKSANKKGAVAAPFLFGVLYLTRYSKFIRSVTPNVAGMFG